jgi:two-component system, chemotaxis family, response regulator Rcp1
VNQSISPSGPVEILLVEDNAADVRLTREAFGETIARNLSVVRDGVEALAFLRREGTFSAAPRPDLILLDLNLPRKSGREVLTEVKADPDLCRIPVVVLTTSSAEHDVNDSYALHANSYVTKPTLFEQFVAVVRAIDAYWLGIVKLPSERNP